MNDALAGTYSQREQSFWLDEYKAFKCRCRRNIGERFLDVPSLTLRSTVRNSATEVKEMNLEMIAFRTKRSLSERDHPAMGMIYTPIPT